MYNVILDHYCKVSRQLVNYHKLNIQFSGDINRTAIKEIAGILQIMLISDIEFI